MLATNEKVTLSVCKLFRTERLEPIKTNWYCDSLNPEKKRATFLSGYRANKPAVNH